MLVTALVHSAMRSREISVSWLIRDVTGRSDTGLFGKL